MISVKYSELVQGPVDVLLCGIPVRLCLSENNSCNVILRLSCVHKFEDTGGVEVEVLVGRSYTFSYNNREEDLKIGRQFTILDAP
jgi:hypothetical protein